MRLTDHYIISGIITLRSGTRIGGADDELTIGGVDLTCIKDPASQRPYLPGSSLKGRMRAQLERHLGKLDGREPCGCAKKDCPVCRIFGPHKKTKHDLGPTRIIVRDASMCDDSTPVLETKVESLNKRDTGAAEHPRSIERVATGTRFQLEIGLQVYDRDKDFRYGDKTGNEALLEAVNHALQLVERTGLGAGTSKGYGQVEITVDSVKKSGAFRPLPAIEEA